MTVDVLIAFEELYPAQDKRIHYIEWISISRMATEGKIN